MKIKLGLTGSIGMGKSTTARLFSDKGCAVWDADAAVHRLYAVGGAAVLPIAEAFPEVIVEGAVSREALKRRLAEDPATLSVLEAIVHPLVREDRKRFAETQAEDIGVFDIPLLFETNSAAEFDAVVCVTIPPEEQKARVLARGTMTEEQFDMILARQMPNVEKCAQADYVIETDTLEHAAAQVDAVLIDVARRFKDA